MKIALLGDLCYVFFNLARALREMGHDAHLWRHDEGFSQAYPEWAEKPWIHLMHSKLDLVKAAARIRLGRFDRVHLMDGAARYGRLLSHRYSVAPGGSDLRHIALEDALLRKGFQHADVLVMSNLDRQILASARKLGLTLHAGMATPVDTELFHPRRRRPNTVPRFLSPSRVDFKTKGTLIAIRGFKRYLDCGNEGTLDVVQFGQDVDRLRKAIAAMPGRYPDAHGRKQSFSHFVQVIPMMSQQQLADAIPRYDAVLDQFRLGVGVAAYQALACGVPVLADTRPLTIPTPVWNAASDRDVADGLERASRLKVPHKPFSEWAQKNASPKAYAKATLDAWSGRNYGWTPQGYYRIKKRS